MRLRQLLPVASLGLLAALLAHTACYGDDHVAGGSHHVALELLALSGAGGFVAVMAAIAWLGAGRHASGSVLAAALRPFIPGFGSLVVSASGWFAAIESIEPEHAFHEPLLLIAVCLVVVTTLIAFVTQWFVRAVAALALAVTTVASGLEPAFYRRRVERCSSARRTDFIYRRFARPPPGVMLPT